MAIALPRSPNSSFPSRSGLIESRRRTVCFVFSGEALNMESVSRNMGSRCSPRSDGAQDAREMPPPAAVAMSRLAKRRLTSAEPAAQSQKRKTVAAAGQPSEAVTLTESCATPANSSHIWASLNEILGDAPEVAAHATSWTANPQSVTSSTPTPVPATSPSAAVHQLAPELVLAGGGGRVAGSWADIEEMERESVQARQAADTGKDASAKPETAATPRTC